MTTRDEVAKDTAESIRADFDGMESLIDDLEAALALVRHRFERLLEVVGVCR